MACNILLADKSGNMVVVECTPTIKKILKAEIFPGGRIVCAVNGFISDEMEPYDDANGNDYDSHKRYKVVIDSFSSGKILKERMEKFSLQLEESPAYKDSPLSRMKRW